VNRARVVTLAAAALNLAVVLLFPPFDQTLLNARVPTFAGFFPFTHSLPNGSINQSLLVLEMIVVAINAGIVWLLLGKREPPAGTPRGRYQRAVLVIVAINLVAILLFPPFEQVYAVTGAALPTFEGFYFVFGAPPGRTIVATILYLEVFLVLINGGLLWLLLRDKGAARMSADEAYRVARKMRQG